MRGVMAFETHGFEILRGKKKFPASASNMMHLI
jgi:hypothetical protein